MVAVANRVWLVGVTSGVWLVGVVNGHAYRKSCMYIVVVLCETAECADYHISIYMCICTM